MKKFIIKYFRDIQFIFKLEPPEYELLHIYARHLTTEEDAIIAFLRGRSSWNENNQRWETTDSKHTIYWFWLSKRHKKIMIITCFANNYIT